MRIQRSWGLCVPAIIALAIAVHQVQAQSYPAPGSAPAAAGYPAVAQQMQPGVSGPVTGPSFAPQYAPAPQYPQYPPQAMVGPGAGAMPMGMPPQGGIMRDMRVPAQGPMMPPGAAYGLQPAAYYNPAQAAPPQTLSPTPAAPMDAAGMGGYTMDGGDPCRQCGGVGCALCSCDDFDLRLLSWLLPYGAGGCAAQRWYDVSFEWVSLQRDPAGDNIVMAMSGSPNGVPALETNQLDFASKSGLRASLAFQLGAGNSLEATYMGLFLLTAQADVASNANDLYSIYSTYGANPPGGFSETDQSSYQRISGSSGFDTVELNYRQRWVSPNVRVQGSWLCGVRYVYMEEDFRYATVSVLNGGSSETIVSVMNSMTGAQVGGDLWVCIMPGLRIGGEVKLGLYGNHALQNTQIATYPNGFSRTEKAIDDNVAFLGDANITMLWRLNQNWTFRTGYTFLWMSEVALATNNFNSNVPITGFAEPRPVVLNNNGDVLYHGFTAGLEFMW